ILCVHLNRWPIDRLLRRRKSRAGSRTQDSGLRTESGGSSSTQSSILSLQSSLVLVETIASRQLVACACGAAFARGVRIGMTLAEARALCPGLAHADHDPDEDARALSRLARWL